MFSSTIEDLVMKTGLIYQKYTFNINMSSRYLIMLLVIKNTALFQCFYFLILLDIL